MTNHSDLPPTSLCNFSVFLKSVHSKCTEQKPCAVSLVLVYLAHMYMAFNWKQLTKFSRYFLIKKLKARKILSSYEQGELKNANASAGVLADSWTPGSGEAEVRGTLPELEQPAQETNTLQKLKDPYSNMPNRLNKTDSHELGWWWVKRTGWIAWLTTTWPLPAV